MRPNVEVCNKCKYAQHFLPGQSYELRMPLSGGGFRCRVHKDSEIWYCDLNSTQDFLATKTGGKMGWDWGHIPDNCEYALEHIVS